MEKMSGEGICHISCRAMTGIFILWLARERIISLRLSILLASDCTLMLRKIEEAVFLKEVVKEVRS
jgi:hypothetical protein